MSNNSSIEFGEEGWTILYGRKISNTIPVHLAVNWYKNDLGPSHCETCRVDGTFEGIFYGLCGQCCSLSERCTCVYCHVAKKDGHNHIERRANMGKFIKTIQLVIDDLRRDYPIDEYGIVQDGIESGFYILTLHTQCQYEKMQLESEVPTEVNQLSIGELIYRWNPTMAVPDSVREAALKAAKRTGILEWVEELWSLPPPLPKVEFTLEEQQLWESFEKRMQYLRPLSDFAEQDQEAATNDDDDDNLYDFDVQCAECETWISAKETDDRDYCRSCQNPEYDPVWPMGD